MSSVLLLCQADSWLFEQPSEILAVLFIGEKEPIGSASDHHTDEGKALLALESRSPCLNEAPASLGPRESLQPAGLG